MVEVKCRGGGVEEENEGFDIIPHGGDVEWFGGDEWIFTSIIIITFIFRSIMIFQLG